jgi:hypothetical protein
MNTNGKDRLAAARGRLADLERRIGPFMPKPVVRSGVKRGEWHSGYNRQAQEEASRRELQEKNQ